MSGVAGAKAAVAHKVKPGNKRHGLLDFRLRKPRSPNDGVMSFWYRIVVILISTFPAWTALVVLGTLNNYVLAPWMVGVAVALAVVPLLLGEILRKQFFEKLLRQEGEEVEVRVTASGLRFTDEDVALLEETEEYGLPEVRGFYQTIGKRIFDIVVVVLMLPVVLPLLCIVAVFIAMDGGKPFYRQQRIGRGGRPFSVWKLRTMVRDADKALEEHLKSDTRARAEWATVQKLKYDPRITHIGQILRRTSIDELPQLWNVLTGSMSMVGPRAILPSQKALYHGSSYFDVRPGVTGLWQVSSRNDVSMDARRRFDQEYVRKMSLRLDIRILIISVGVALRGTGY